MSGQTMVTSDKLKRFSIFKYLTDEKLSLIAEIADEQDYDANTEIFRQKSPAKNLYLLLEGRVVIKLKCSDERMVVIDEIKPGEIFGWSAITDPYTFTASAWTTESSKVIIVYGQLLRRLFEDDKEIGFYIVDEIATLVGRRFRALEAKLADMLCRIKG